MAVYAAAIAAVLEIGQSVLGAKSKRRAQHKYSKRLNRMANISDSVQGHSLQQQEMLSRLGTEQLVGGYDTARKEAGRLGRGSKRRALDREQQLGGSLAQGMQNRGLGSTTVGANLQRGLASDTGRQMADIDEGLAGMFGNLALGRAGAEAAGSQQLAGLSQRRADVTEKNQAMRTFGHLFGQSPWASGGSSLVDMSPAQSGLSSIVGGLQTGLGAYMGMSGGGGGGRGGGGTGGMSEMEEMMRWMYQQQSGDSGHTMSPGPWASGYQR
jgi:hypothetical protein